MVLQGCVCWQITVSYFCYDEDILVHKTDQSLRQNQEKWSHSIVELWPLRQSKMKNLWPVIDVKLKYPKIKVSLPKRQQNATWYLDEVNREKQGKEWVSSFCRTYVESDNMWEQDMHSCKTLVTAAFTGGCRLPAGKKLTNLYGGTQVTIWKCQGHGPLGESVERKCSHFSYRHAAGRSKH